MNKQANPAIKLMGMSDSRRKWFWHWLNGGKMTYRAWKASMELHK